MHIFVAKQSLTFFPLGHETTGNTLSWLFYLLSYHPNCVKRIQQELDSVLGARTSPTFDDLPKFKYLKACINEALRVYPSQQRIIVIHWPSAYTQLLQIYSVLAKKTPNLVDSQLEKEYVPSVYYITTYLFIIPQQDLFVNMSVVTSNPKFFPDPKKFDPDRFEASDASSDVQAGGEKIIPYPNKAIPNLTSVNWRECKYSFLPFGIGQRQCIGRAFATLEMLIVVSSVLKNLDIEQTPRTAKDVTEVYGVTLAPSTEIYLKFTKRL